MSITPGQPVWIDLGTTDLERSKAFYRDLFDWNFSDTGGEFGHYHMVDAGVPVGGLGPNVNAEGNIDASMPVWWTVYLKVEDVDATLAAVREHGGHVHVEPMQIGDMGRMAIVAAPSGAAFGVWEVGSFEGFDTEGRPGTPVWFEALTKDFDADAAFYAAVLGWKNVPMREGSSDEGAAEEDGAGMRYVTDAAGDDASAGLFDAAAFLPAEVPSHWRVYFAVPDTDAAVEKVLVLGGAVVEPAQDSPYGRVAAVADDLGGTFMVIA